MVSEKMYELGTKKSTIRTIFEFGQKRVKEVGKENNENVVFPLLSSRTPYFSA